MGSFSSKKGNALSWRPFSMATEGRATAERDYRCSGAAERSLEHFQGVIGGEARPRAAG